jgi:hypothetical protein
VPLVLRSVILSLYGLNGEVEAFLLGVKQEVPGFGKKFLVLHRKFLAFYRNFLVEI